MLNVGRKHREKKEGDEQIEPLSLTKTFLSQVMNGP